MTINYHASMATIPPLLLTIIIITPMSITSYYKCVVFPLFYIYLLAIVYVFKIWL